ncbi:MAG: hypothetical protein ACOH2J_09220 [Allorhizobium sp.]
MKLRYCDIMPNSDGWIFVIDGELSPVYPSYVMAVSAARQYARDNRGAGTPVLVRSQDLQGIMQEI